MGAFYLARSLDGDGSDATPWRAPGGSRGTRAALFDLRADSTQNGPALVYLEQAFTDARLIELADLPDDTLTARQRSEVGSALGLTIAATRFDLLCAELLADPNQARSLGRRIIRPVWKTKRTRTNPLQATPQERIRRIEFGGQVVWESGTVDVRNHRTLIIHESGAGGGAIDGDDVNGATPDTVDNGNAFDSHADEFEFDGAGEIDWQSAGSDLSIDAGVTDATYYFDIRGGGSAWLVHHGFRCQTTLVNDNLCRLQAGGTTFVLQKRVGGSVTDLDNPGFTFDTTTAYTVEIEIIGDNARGLVDDSEIATGSLSGDLSSNTLTYNLGSAGPTTAKIADIKVEDLTPAGGGLAAHSHHYRQMAAQ